MFLRSFSVQQTTYRIGKPRILLGIMVEARSVNVKKTTTTTTVTDRALTIRSNIRGCQSCTTWSAGQEKYQRNIYGESSKERMKTK